MTLRRQNVYCRKILTLICSLTECLIYGGPTFGWASLVYVLRDRGYFSEQCQNSTITSDDLNDTYIDNQDAYPTCPEQDALLQLVFTVGAFGVNSSSFTFGPVYDKYGTRLTRLISSVFILLACVMFAFSSQATAYIIFPALHILASGGILLLVTNFQVGNLYGSYRSTVVTLHSGAFGSSAILMLFIMIAYTHGVSMKVSFLFLACLTVFFNINTFVLMPKYKIPWPLPENWGKPSNNHCKLQEEAETIELNEPSSTVAVATPSWIDVEYPNIYSCLKSSMFLLFLMWFAVIQLVHLFYIGTFNPRLQLLTKDDKDTISTYTFAFTAIQAGGVLCAPFCGLVLDRNKKHTDPVQQSSLDDLRDSILAFVLTNLATAAFSVFMMTPILHVQFITFFFQVLGRAFLYGLVAAYLSMTFPGRYFGSLYGIASIIAACVALCQYPLFKLVQGQFDNNPFYVDMFLLILNICTLTHPWYVYHFLCKKKLKILNDIQPADSWEQQDMNILN